MNANAHGRPASAGAAFLIGLRYAFVDLRGTAEAAFHTVNALPFSWGSATLALRAGRLGRLDAEG